MAKASKQTLLFLVVLSSCLSLASSESQQAFVYCNVKPSQPAVYVAKFVLFKKDDAVRKIVAFDLNNNAMYDECSTLKSQFISGDGSDNDPYIMEVSFYQNGTTLTSTDCGVEANPGELIYKWYLESSVSDREMTSPIMLQGEYNYDVECNFKDVTAHSPADEPDFRVTPAGRGGARDVNNTKEDVSFYVGDSNGDRTQSARLDETITLNIELNVNADGGASGVYATNCRACSDNTCSFVSTVYEMTKDSGCISAAADKHLGDENGPFFEPETAVKHKTIPFAAFRFVVTPDPSTSDLVFFFCKINYCFGSDVSKCTDYGCTKQRRRRRSADDDKSVEMKTFLIVNNDKTPKQEEAKTPEPVVCTSTTMYMALTISLGILLLSSLCVTVAVFVRTGHMKKFKNMS